MLDYTILFITRVKTIYSLLLAFNIIQGLLTRNLTRTVPWEFSRKRQLWTTEMEIRELNYFEIY